MSGNKEKSLRKAESAEYKIAGLETPEGGVMMHNYPATVKYAMELMGRPVGLTRKPILPPTAEEKAWVKAELSDLGVFEKEPHGWNV